MLKLILYTILLIPLFGCTISSQKSTTINTVKPKGARGIFGALTETWDGELSDSSFRNALPIHLIREYRKDSPKITSYRGYYTEFTGITVIDKFYFVCDYPPFSPTEFSGRYDFELSANTKIYKITGRFTGHVIGDQVVIEMPISIDTSVSHLKQSPVIQTKFTIRGTSYIYDNLSGIYSDKLKNIERPHSGCFILGVLEDSAKVIVPPGTFLMASSAM